MKKVIHKLLFVSIMILLLACGSKSFYDEVHSFNKDGWMASDTLAFNVAVTDTAAIYDLLLHVRTTRKYPYSNLWLFIETKAPNGLSHYDTLEIVLADPTGRWLGTGNGNVNTMLVPYLAEVKFKYRGVYKVAIQQAMRDEQILPEVLDLGLRLEEHTKK